MNKIDHLSAMRGRGIQENDCIRWRNVQAKGVSLQVCKTAYPSMGRRRNGMRLPCNSFHRLTMVAVLPFHLFLPPRRCHLPISQPLPRPFHMSNLRMVFVSERNPFHGGTLWSAVPALYSLSSLSKEIKGTLQHKSFPIHRTRRFPSPAELCSTIYTHLFVVRRCSSRYFNWRSDSQEHVFIGELYTIQTLVRA